MMGGANFSNSPHDHAEIIDFIDDKIGEQGLEEDLNEFKTLRYYFEKFYHFMGKINADLFLKRAALIILDEDSYSYLSNIEKNELICLINDIAPEYHPLMKAVKRRDYDGTEFLLKNQADPNVGTEPWFPLQQADLNNDIKMIALLEKYGADWDKCLRVYKAWNKKAYKRKTQ